jgi:HEAT repeat protein
MKFALMGVVLVVAGFFAFQQLKPKPAPPPPPPPPPAITLEPQPIIDPAEQAKIVKSASDQDPGVRWEALVLLDKMKSPQALPLMFEKLEKDPEPEVRIKIIKVLSARKGPEITQHLVGALKDLEPSVRVEALIALDQIGDFAAASAITDTLKDQEETVRIQALKTLNSLQDKKAAEIAAEQKRQEELRRQAEEAARKR